MNINQSRGSQPVLNPALRAQGAQRWLRVRCWLLLTVGRAHRLLQASAPRIVDVVVSALLVTLLSPILLLRGLVARWRQGRFFDRAVCFGRGGVPFELLAFSGDEAGRELARLFNLLRGDLALVGPRLRSPALEPGYTGSDEALRLSAAPGLVSLYETRQQVGIAHEAEVLMDREFLYTRSLKGDSTLLLRSLFSRALVGGQHSESPPNFSMLGVPLMNCSMPEAINWMLECTVNATKTHVAFANADCLNIAVKDAAYAAVLGQADGILPDGIGIKIACRIQGISMRDNLNGTDMFPLLCEGAAQRQLSVYLLGARPEMAAATAQNMCDRYPKLQIAGSHHGYFDVDQEAAMVDEINASGADILLVAMGAPLQEQFIARWQEQLQVPLRVGVGGLFDYYSGRIARAPRWLREIGMEWIWRILQEPGRMWRRYVIGNPVFIYRVWREQRVRSDRLAGLPQVLRVNPATRGVKALIAAIKRYRWSLVQALTCFGKRGLDVLVAGGLLLLLSPLFALVALLIKIDSPGPVFYCQTRVGRWGRTFPMWKFRSMCTDADHVKAALAEQNQMQGGVIFKMKQDPRVTRVGRVIRRLSIDELPQLWNVLHGDMTLVGPRPSLPNEVSEYQLDDRGRLEAVPGLTCIWQVSGRSEIPFEGQVAMDIEYIQTHSLKKDFVLLAKTVPAVVSGRGAY